VNLGAKFSLRWELPEISAILSFILSALELSGAYDPSFYSKSPHTELFADNRLPYG
jgi:hypothetical protein